MADYNGIKFFQDNIVTLKETSKDSHGDQDVFMTQSSLKVVNFDAVKDDYVKNLGLSETPFSNDALVFTDDGEYYFIEFKNGHINSEIVIELRRKIYDSLLIFTDIIGKGISFTREKMSYILVYNEDRNLITEGETNQMQHSPSRRKIAVHFIEKMAKERFAQFGLGRYDKLCYKNMYAYDKEEFEREFVQRHSESA